MSAEQDLSSVLDGLEIDKDIISALKSAEKELNRLRQQVPDDLTDVAYQERLAIAHLSVADVAGQPAFGVTGQVFTVMHLEEAVELFNVLGKTANAGKINVDLVNLIHEIPSDRLEAFDSRLLKAHKGALAYYTEDSDPEIYAQLKRSMAITYTAWQREGHTASTEQAQSYGEEALAALQDAQSVWTAKTNRTAWGELQVRQARILLMESRNRIEKQAEGIKILERALAVLTPQNDLLLWASCKQLLAEFYFMSSQGVQSANRALAENAIRDALDHLTPDDEPNLWGLLQGLLGRAIFEDPELHPGERAVAAIALMERALASVSPNEQPGAADALERNLAVMRSKTGPLLIRDQGPDQSAVDAAFAKVDPQGDPYSKAQAMRVRADIFRRLTRDKILLRTPDRAEYALAIEASDQALAVLAAGRYPLEQLRALIGRIQIETDIGDWVSAAKMGEDIAALLLQLLDDFETEEETRDVIRMAEPALSLACHAYITLSAPARAFDLLDLTRSDLAARTLASARDVTDAERDTLKTFQKDLAALRDLNDPASQNAKQRLRSGITKLRTGPKTETGKLVPPAGVVFLTMVVTDAGGAVLLRTDQNIYVQPLQERSMPVVFKKMYGSISAADGANWDWGQGEMSGQMASDLALPIWQVFDQAQLCDVTQIVWIPPAEFCPIPLCAARHPIVLFEGRMIDAHEIVTAPSFQMWGQIHAGKTKDLSSASVCGLFNPTRDLIFAGIEEHLITSLAKHMALAKIAVGTDVNTLLENLAGHDIWHFATHNRFDWANYLMSGLELGRDTSGSARRLCIEDILYQSDSHAPQLVLLTVCDSGHSDIKHHPDEIMGLPTAFLAKGARGVVSASWKVNDLATALLVARVYDGLASRGTHPASVLRQAQIWLRDSSGIELFEYLQNVYLALPTDGAKRQFAPLIRQAAAIAEDPAPFSDERFWAGFTYMGA